MSTSWMFDMLDAIREKDVITTEDIDFLEKCSKSRNTDIRYAAAEQLSVFDSLRAEKILLRMLSDKDEMVRANVCDSIGISRSKETIEVLKNYAITDTWLVRGYAIASMGDIALNSDADKTDLISFLEQSLQQETETWVKASYYRTLYILGRAEYLSKLLALINDDTYYVRCAVISCIESILNKENAEEICNALNIRLQIEDPQTRSVVCSIKRILHQIQVDYLLA